MEDTPTFVLYALGVSDLIKYPLIFLGTLIEGPIVMVASGFLLHFGAFHVVPLFIALVLGDLVADIFWYYIGARYAGRFLMKFGKFFSLTPEMIEKLKTKIRKHSIVMLLGSKLTAGFGLALAVVIAAGASHVPFKRYMTLNIIGEFIVATMLLVVGYYFGQVYTYIDNSLKLVFIVSTSVFLLLAAYGFTRFIRSKAEKTLI